MVLAGLLQTWLVGFGSNDDAGRRRFGFLRGRRGERTAAQNRGTEASGAPTPDAQKEVRR